MTSRGPCHVPPAPAPHLRYMSPFAPLELSIIRDEMGKVVCNDLGRWDRPKAYHCMELARAFALCRADGERCGYCVPKSVVYITARWIWHVHACTEYFVHSKHGWAVPFPTSFTTCRYHLIRSVGPAGVCFVFAPRYDNALPCAPRCRHAVAGDQPSLCSGLARSFGKSRHVLILKT